MSRKIGFWLGVAVSAFRAYAGAQETCKTIVAAERSTASIQLTDLGLAFESAGGACGQFDGVFGAGFFGVLFEGQLDEFVDELGEGNAAGFPEFGVHADGGEAGDGVHFVEIDFSAFFSKEKIDASHAV
jgi:hypothetical protein